MHKDSAKKECNMIYSGLAAFKGDKLAGYMNGRLSKSL
jgi:hypothetical protein